MGCDVCGKEISVRKNNDSKDFVIVLIFCDDHLSDFNNSKTIRLKPNTRLATKGSGDFDFHSALPKTPLNPPGYKYLGPNNPLEDQVDLNTGIPRPGNEPKNDLDRIALKHDLLYYHAEKDGLDKRDVLKKKHLADEILIKECKATPGKTWGEKAMNWISRNLISLKMKLGMGINEDDIKLKLHKIKTKRELLKYLKENVQISHE